MTKYLKHRKEKGTRASWDKLIARRMHGVNNLRQFAIFGRSVWHKFRTTSLPKIRFEVLVAGIHRPLTIYVR